MTPAVPPLGRVELQGGALPVVAQVTQELEETTVESYGLDAETERPNIAEEASQGPTSSARIERPLPDKSSTDSTEQAKSMVIARKTTGDAASVARPVFGGRILSPTSDGPAPASAKEPRRRSSRVSR